MSPKKILIAEDELIIAKVYSNLFKAKGYEVICVTTSEEAIAQTLKQTPDWILLDVFLKGSSCGIDAAKQLRNKGIQSPIIFTTGNSASSTKEDTKDISNTHLLIKPVEFDTILSIVEKK